MQKPLLTCFQLNPISPISFCISLTFPLNRTGLFYKLWFMSECHVLVEFVYLRIKCYLCMTLFLNVLSSLFNGYHAALITPSAAAYVPVLISWLWLLHSFLFHAQSNRVYTEYKHTSWLQTYYCHHPTQIH
jgi:hypothetical protein